MERKIKYKGRSLTGTIIEGKEKLAPCDYCDKEVLYRYEVTMAEFWFAECSHCGRLTIEWVDD